MQMTQVFIVKYMYISFISPIDINDQLSYVYN